MYLGGEEMNIKVLKAYMELMSDNQLSATFIGLKKFNASWKYNILRG